MFKSLKDAKQFLEDFFNTHKQINQVYYGNDSDLNAIEEKNYPLCQIEYLGSPISNRNIQYRFNITIQDLYNGDFPETEIEIHDFAILVIRDFIAFLNLNQIDFYSGNINVFKDSDDDITAGATIGFIMTFPLMANECNIPL